jgi:hypothetical protein
VAGWLAIYDRPMLHDVTVTVISPEAAQDGVAEFRCRGRLIGFTVLREGELVLQLTADSGDEPLQINAHSFMEALLEAKSLLS